MTKSLTVEERGRPITFTLDDMLRYHGGHSPAGVAMAFKVMQRALAYLSPDGPPDRRAHGVSRARRTRRFRGGHPRRERRPLRRRPLAASIGSRTAAGGFRF